MTLCEGMRVRRPLPGGHPGTVVGTVEAHVGDVDWLVAWDDGDRSVYFGGMLAPADEPPATRPVRTDWKVGWTVRLTDYARGFDRRIAARPATVQIAGIDVKGGVTIRFADGGHDETFYNVTPQCHVAMCLDVVPAEAAAPALPSVYEMAREIGLAGSPGGSDLAVGALTAALAGEKPRWRCPCCGGETREIPRRSGARACVEMHCSPDSEKYNVAYPVTWWGLKGETMIELAAEAGRRCMIHGSEVVNNSEPSPSAMAARYFYSGQARADIERADARWPCPCCGDAPTPDSCGAPSHPCRLGRQHGPAAPFVPVVAETPPTCPACHFPTEATPEGPRCAKCGCLTRFLRPAGQHKHRWIVRGDRARCAVGDCKAERAFSRASTGMGGPTVTCRYGCAVSLRGDGLRVRHAEGADAAPPGRYVSAMLQPVNRELRYGATHYGCSACGAQYVKTVGDAP